MNISNENGRSMVEMLGVLAIIGVLSVTGFSMVNKMQSSYEINQVIDAAGELATRTRNVMRNYDLDDDGDAKNTSMNDYLMAAKAVPDEFLNNNEFAIDEVTYNVQYLGDSVTFVVQVQNLTEEMCIQMVTTNWGGPGTSGFLGMSVDEKADSVNEAIKKGNSGSATIALISSTDHPAPMGIGAAATACGDGKTVNLSFR